MKARSCSASPYPVKRSTMCAEYNRKDRLYEKAKEDGYRSRAAYKLLELNKKHKFIRAGSKVLDLGAWPGGWMQVTSNIVGDSGLVVGIDLVELDPIPGTNSKLLCGDAREDSNIRMALEIAGTHFDVVVSDMSPKLTGIREADQAGTVACAELALYVASQVLKKNGDLVIKVFKGNDTEQFIRELKPSFEKVIRSELDATRRTSNEYYVLARGYRRSDG